MIESGALTIVDSTKKDVATRPSPSAIRAVSPNPPGMSLGPSSVPSSSLSSPPLSDNVNVETKKRSRDSGLLVEEEGPHKKSRNNSSDEVKALLDNPFVRRLEEWDRITLKDIADKDFERAELLISSVQVFSDKVRIDRGMFFQRLTESRITTRKLNFMLSDNGRNYINSTRRLEAILLAPDDCVENFISPNFLDSGLAQNRSNLIDKIYHQTFKDFKAVETRFLRFNKQVEESIKIMDGLLKSSDAKVLYQLGIPTNLLESVGDIATIKALISTNARFFFGSLNNSVLGVEHVKRSFQVLSSGNQPRLINEFISSKNMAIFDGLLQNKSRFENWFMPLRRGSLMRTFNYFEEYKEELFANYLNRFKNIKSNNEGLAGKILALKLLRPDVKKLADAINERRTYSENLSETADGLIKQIDTHIAYLRHDKTLSIDEMLNDE